MHAVDGNKIAMKFRLFGTNKCSNQKKVVLVAVCRIIPGEEVQDEKYVLNVLLYFKGCKADFDTPI